MPQLKPSIRRGPTAAERVVLHLLLEHRYLTAHLIVQAYSYLFGEGVHFVPKLLARLRRQGWILPFYRTNRPGSSEYVYTISKTGARQLLTPTEYRSERRRIYNLEKPKANYEHELGLSTLHLLWELGSRHVDDVFRTVWHWHDREGSRTNKINHFAVWHKGEYESIEPDHTYLIDHRRGDFYRPYFLQYEHSTKNHERLREHFRIMTTLLAGTGATSEVRQVFLKHTGIEPTRGFAVYVTDTDYEARTLQKLAMAMAFESRWRSRQWPRIFFSSMDRLKYVDYVRDARGVPLKNRHGRPWKREGIITPTHFFTKQLFFDLKGRPRYLVHANP